MEQINTADLSLAPSGSIAWMRQTLLAIRALNMTEPDENGCSWAISDLIEQEIVAALAMLPVGVE